jgi:hypothetical protein
MRNFTSPNVEQLDVLWATRVLNESRMNKNTLPIDYKSTPEVAIIKFDQERELSSSTGRWSRYLNRDLRFGR